MAVQNIDLWVSAGSFGAPYYRFYTDSGGSNELSNLSLDTNKSYTFRRLNDATSHPFYLSDTAYKTNSSNALLITGNGSPSQGITGNESFKVEFVGDSAGSIEELLYYCSSHQYMQGNIALTEPTPEPTTEPEPEPTPEPEPEPTPEPEPEPTPEPEPEPEPTPETEPEPTPEPEPEEYEPPATSNEIKGTKNDDKLNGSQESDFINGKKGDDTLKGKKGSDVLKGGSGADILSGSKGKDYLDGSKGFDTLIGGKGADVFQISKGIDIVEDFSIRQGDRIALDKKGRYTIIESDDGDGVLILTSAKKQLFLQDVEYGDIIAAGVDIFFQPI